MDNIKKDIEEALKFDSLSEAEKITGKSYKESEFTTMIGLAMQIENSKKKEILMDATDDTKFSETRQEYLRKVMDFGFEIIYEEDYISDSKNDGSLKGVPVDENGYFKEKLYCLWHNEYSILLVFDTHWDNRNSGHFYYNWSPNNIKHDFNLTSSGGFEGLNWLNDFSKEIEYEIKEPTWDTSTQKYEDFSLINKKWREEYYNWRSENNLRAVWVGNHDCREALKFNINNLANNGTFLKEWKKQPFLWVLHYMDTRDKNYNHKELSRKRIEKFPEYVKKMILA